MQMHLLAINDVHSIHHILDEHLVRGTGRMGADQRFGLLGTLAFLAVVQPGLVLALVAVHGILPLFRDALDRPCQQLVQSRNVDPRIGP